MTMSLGTALSIMGLSLAVRYARERTVALVWRRHVPELGNADGQNCRRDCSDTVRDDPVPDGDPRQRRRRLYCRRMLIKKPASGGFLSLVNSWMLIDKARAFCLERLNLCVNIFNLLLYIIVVLTQDLFRFLNIRRRRRCPFQRTIRRLLHGNTGNQADHRNDHQIVSRHHQVLRAPPVKQQASASGPQSERRY